MYVVNKLYTIYNVNSLNDYKNAYESYNRVIHVDENHEAIIQPEMWDMVQKEGNEHLQYQQERIPTEQNIS